MNIPDFAASIVFLIRVRLPGGAAIIFAQSWSFELKFFVDIYYTTKLALGVCESIFCPKTSQNGQKLDFEDFMDSKRMTENDPQT